MSNRIRLAVAAAAALVATMLAAGPAHAEDPKADHRPCVTNREFNALRSNTPRREVEERWEVRGLGRPVQEAYFRRPMIAYPWCDHGSMNQAYVAVLYRPNHTSGWSEQYDCRWEGNTCP